MCLPAFNRVVNRVFTGYWDEEESARDCIASDQCNQVLCPADPLYNDLIYVYAKIFKVIFISHSHPYRIAKYFLMTTTTTLNKSKKKLNSIINIDDQKMIYEKKDDFISFVSHELKTPLTTAKIYMQLLNDLLKNEGSEKAILYAKNTTTCIEKINSLLIELMDVTKLKRVKMTLK